MKIVNLIEETDRTVILMLSGADMPFFGDTVEKFNIKAGDVVIARGVNELYMGTVVERKAPPFATYGDYLVLTDVEISYHFCNI